MTRDKHMRIAVIALILSVGLAAFGWWGSHRMPPSKFPEIAGDFTLQGADGPVTMRDFRGKVTVLFFGYARCPDVCPATLVNLANVAKRLDPAELSRVKFVFVSLDPERDTPAIASRYARHFHPDFLGLSGSAEQTAAAAKAFSVGYRKEQSDSAAGYTLSHTSYLFVVRPDGSLGDLLGHADPPEKIVKIIRRWLKWADG